LNQTWRVKSGELVLGCNIFEVGMNNAGSLPLSLFALHVMELQQLEI
jgi:hypothetical protein